MTSSGIKICLLLAMFCNGFADDSYTELEKHLLKRLVLNQRPVTDKNVNIPHATMELYKKMLEKHTVTNTLPLPGLFTDSANTIRTYINKGSTPINSKSQRYRLVFDIDQFSEKEQVKAAEVRLAMSQNTKLRKIKSVHVLIHDIVQPGIKGSSSPILRLIDSKSVNLSINLRSEVISFDVTPAIERLWENNFLENHGIIVQCVTVSGKQVRLLDVFDFQSTDPLLMIYTDDGTNKKKLSAKTIVERHLERRRRELSRRSADDAVETSTAKEPNIEKQICRRHSLPVRFDDIGLGDWIVYPEEYNMYYCLGVCGFPLAGHLNASNHAVLRTMVSFARPTLLSQACCVPTKLGKLTVLYQENETTFLKSYDDMVVEGCGCR